MSSLQPARGTRDILPAECRRHRQVVETSREIAERYGFDEISTPIFEFTDVFRRTLGETSDVVTKEMYSFVDRGGEELTLRPEYTAGIARAFISGGLKDQAPLKFFGHGPMFRYERPQKGRFRQFHQIDVEILGVAEPIADIEVIAVGAHILEALDLADLVRLELNSLGDPQSRAAYRKLLVDYFQSHRNRLSEDSLARLERNPLRILDSKDQGDKDLIADAPLLSDHLNNHSRRFFEEVCAGLDGLGIAYQINPKLVRGLDYYPHTAFEFITESLGAQGAVIAGGRYDGLVEAMGGPPTPGIGWAGGIERLALLIAEPPPVRRPVCLVPLGAEAEGRAIALSGELRHAGYRVEMATRGNLRRRMKAANKIGASAVVLLGEDELAKGVGTVRDLDSGAQSEVALDRLAAELAMYR